jgi:hypothetical protein
VENKAADRHLLETLSSLSPYYSLDKLFYSKLVNVRVGRLRSSSYRALVAVLWLEKFCAKKMDLKEEVFPPSPKAKGSNLVRPNLGWLMWPLPLVVGSSSGFMLVFTWFGSLDLWA